MTDNSTKTTVDPKETELFNAVSAIWWEDSGIQILKQLDVKIEKYISEQIIKLGIANKKYQNTPTPLRGIKILEVGCGGGFLSEELARTGCDLTGIEPNDSLLQVAKDHAAADPTLPKISYLVGTVEEYCKTHSGEYDVVVSNFVLEHVSDHKYFIECCSKLVKPGGSMFISAVAKTYLAWFIQIFLMEYVLRWLPIGAHEVNKLINASITEDLIKSCGFKIEETRGLLYDVFTRRVYWIPIHSNLYITHAVKKKDNEKKID